MHIVFAQSKWTDQTEAKLDILDEEFISRK